MRNYADFFDLSTSQEAYPVVSPVKQSGEQIIRFKKGNVEVVEAELFKNNSLLRPEGKYFTYALRHGSKKDIETLVKFLTRAITQLISPDAKRVLVAGMGNEQIVSDSLGVKVVKSLDINQFGEGVYIAKFCPDVEGNSGIESKSIIEALIAVYKPDVVIVIDSLCTRSYDKLGCSFQVCNAGIIPGSGVGNYSCNLNAETLGCDIVAIGVPLVLNLRSFMITSLQKIKPLDISYLRAIDELCDRFDAIFAPKDIDVMVKDCSMVITRAIVKAINKII